ncbi:MAG: glycosyltransferase family 4 protein [Anaerolineales bacterium]|nr:glycosyltransferase family 4 protein [Anaerolineales bacterium]
MKIGMVLFDMQELGGLEEYTITLAIGLQQQGHDVTLLSTAWVNPNNQYLMRLKKSPVKFFHLPKWISYPASDWDTKERILNGLTWLFSPFIFILGILLLLSRKQSGVDAFRSARNWLRGQLMKRFVGPDWRKPFVRFMLGMWKLLWRPDILHIQGYTTSLLFVVDWAYQKKLPIVYEEHQTPDPQFDWWQGFDKSINKANVVVAVSEKSADALRTVCGVTQPIVVQGPLVPDPVESGFDVNEIEQGLDSLQLTAVARLFVTKGLIYLLDALKVIREKYPKIHLKVYGDGPLRDELMSHADQLGLNGNEIFVGAFTSRDDLSRIMAETDIFVMPSILEGQPVSLVEAMAHGRPIVATTVGGIPELIEDGVNGLLCSPGDSKCLTQKILLMLDEPILRLNLGKAARKSYEQGPFQPASVCRDFVSIYNKVLLER